jgi:hypothetical protein
MADDDAETLRTLNEFRAVFRKRIEAHSGKLIDTAGDSILGEFPSAVEAVDCAIEIQHELTRRNAQLAEHRRMQYRIGVNLGDVIEQEDGTIYGDGVNVAPLNIVLRPLLEWPVPGRHRNHATAHTSCALRKPDEIYRSVRTIGTTRASTSILREMPKGHT